jgi:hypothetical protein
MARKIDHRRFNVWQALFGTAVVVLVLGCALVAVLAQTTPTNGPARELQKIVKTLSSLGFSLGAAIIGLLKHIPGGWKRSGGWQAPRLTPLEAGLYGGLVGGLAAGLIIAIFYYFDNLTKDGLQIDAMTCPMILGYASLAGAAGGAAIQSGVQRFCRLAGRGHTAVLFNEITGATVYGVLVVGLVGGLGGLYFGPLKGDFVGTGTVLWPVALGMICLILGILSREFRTWVEFLRGLVLVTLLSIPLGMLGALLLQKLPIDRFFTTERAGPVQMFEGGLLFGLCIGFFCGAVSGLTLLLYRLWQKHASVRA